MKQAAASQFHDDLYVGEFSAENSAANVHLQITDLFTSSIGRRLNASGDRNHPKDQFADYFLVKLGHTDMTQSEAIGDMTAHIALWKSQRDFSHQPKVGPSLTGEELPWVVVKTNSRWDSQMVDRCGVRWFL